MNRFHIFTTGGTIDKIYFDAKSQYQIGEAIVEHLLHQAAVTLSYEITPLMQKDSLDLTDTDRDLIYQAVDACKERHILITHGTDTMVITGQILKPIMNKVIVLTGSLTPARFQTSDAMFNIGFAIGALHALSSGVWIAMNGHIFPIDQAQKNVEKNCFEFVE